MVRCSPCMCAASNAGAAHSMKRAVISSRRTFARSVCPKWPLSTSANSLKLISNQGDAREELRHLHIRFHAIGRLAERLTDNMHGLRDGDGQYVAEPIKFGCIDFSHIARHGKDVPTRTAPESRHR